MSKKKIPFKEFKIPESFFENLFELTGSLDKNKGYIIFYIDEGGFIQIRQKFDCQTTEFALNRAIDIFMSENCKSVIFESENESDEDDD
jgi:hypothetical protein